MAVSRHVATQLTICLACLLSATTLNGQESATGPNEPMVEWNFPPQTEVRELVDFVANKLDFGVLYDNRINDVRITIRAKRQVPRTSILALLETALRMKDLALVDAEIPGWKRVVGVNELVTSTRINQVDSTADRRPSSPVTEIIQLEYLDATTVSASLRGFLSSSSDLPANVKALTLQDPQLQMLTGPNLLQILKGPNALIVTDFADNVDRIKTLIGWLDVQHVNETVKLIQLRHADSKAVADTLANVVSAGKKSDPRALAEGNQGRNVRIVHDDRSNQLILIGSKPEVEELADIVENLDAEDNATIRSYTLQFASVELFHELLQAMFEDGESNSVKTSISPGGEAILVRAKPLEHDRVAAILKQIDVAKPQDQSRVRFYHLDHTTAAEILSTMRALESDGEGQRGAGGSGGFFPGGGYPGGVYPGGGYNSGFDPRSARPQSQMGGTSTFPSNIRSRSNSRFSR